jgi:hypothetical protein
MRMLGKDVTQLYTYRSKRIKELPLLNYFLSNMLKLC